MKLKKVHLGIIIVKGEQSKASLKTFQVAVYHHTSVNDSVNSA